MPSPENVDSRASDGLVWRLCELTFSITYSADKIAQTGIVEPIQSLPNKKTLAQLWAEIILSTERSNLRLHLAVLNEMGGGKS